MDELDIKDIELSAGEHHFYVKHTVCGEHVSECPEYYDASLTSILLDVAMHLSNCGATR